MEFKDFNEDEHLTCPVCGFEVVYLTDRAAAYLFKDFAVDRQTVTYDNEVSEQEKICCNHIHCDWEINLRGPYEER